MIETNAHPTELPLTPNLIYTFPNRRSRCW